MEYVIIGLVHPCSFSLSICVLCVEYANKNFIYSISCEFHIGWFFLSCALFTNKVWWLIANYARNLYVVYVCVYQIECAHAQTINHKVIICVLQPSKYRKKFTDSRAFCLRIGTEKRNAKMYQAIKYICVYVCIAKWQRPNKRRKSC